MATVESLAKQLKSESINVRIIGDQHREISDAMPFMLAEESHCTLVDEKTARQPQLVEKIMDSHASAVITPVELAHCPKTQLVVDDPHVAFASIIRFLRPAINSECTGISSSATIDDSATVHQSASVGPNCVIGAGAVIGANVTLHSGVQIGDGCCVGDNSEIFPNATLYHETRVGKNCMIHAGAILGAYGFGYQQRSGEHVRTSQLGNVILEDDVEIGANTTIDRGTYGPTKIGQGTKIDNLVMIGHNCVIGKKNLICSQAGIAGSCSTGDYVVIAGQVGLRDHIHIGDRVTLCAQSGVAGDVADDQVLMGSPAVDQKTAIKFYTVQPKLPEMRKQIKQMMKQISELQSEIEDSRTASSSNENKSAA